MGLTSSLALLGISLALRLPLTGYSSQTYLVFLGAAVVSQIGGYFSIGYALRHLPASVVSPSMLGQPVVTAILALVFLGEALSTSQWFGGIVVLTGIYLVHLGRGN